MPAAPFINKVAFPGTQSGYYWSSTTFVPNPTLTLAVKFNYGTAGGYSKTDTYYVRCVRAGP